MSDITKCNNAKCPLRQECYRATAPNGLFQSWAGYVYTEKFGCVSFVPSKSKERRHTQQKGER